MKESNKYETLSMSHDKELFMPHDGWFVFIDNLILFSTIIASIATFIWGLVLIVSGAAIGLVVLITGALSIFVGYNVSKFVLSVVYDLKLIRNNLLKANLNTIDSKAAEQKNTNEEKELSEKQNI